MNSVKMSRPGRNTFDLTHDVKMSLDMGGLYPITAIECYPGDVHRINAEILLRMMPMVTPPMHKVDVYTHFFFVPNRLTYEDWETFISPNKYGIDVPPVPPYLTFNNDFKCLQGSLGDYMGVPVTPAMAGGEIRVNAFPFAGYNLIWNEYFRDQNLQGELVTQLSDGNNTISNFTDIQMRAWEHDYFTSNLPQPQAGATVDVPLGDVILKDGPDRAGALPIFRDTSGAHGGNGDVQQTNSDGLTITGAVTDLAYDPDGTLEVGATTINNLRIAFRLQEWLEKSARAGRRYIESILGHFGVRSDDARLQRPEYICGSQAPVIISEVLNTTGTEDLPQGNMAGHGISVTNGHKKAYHCKEHGWLIGLVSVRPRTAYQQGLPRSLNYYSRSTAVDYMWPEFAHLGEQGVLNDEIYAYQNGNTGRGVFGYNPRFAELRTQPNRVAGEMRSTLDSWHLGRIFETAPALNEDFIKCVPTKRIFAVQDEDIDSLVAHVRVSCQSSRLLPKYGTPTF